MDVKEKLKNLLFVLEVIKYSRNLFKGTKLEEVFKNAEEEISKFKDETIRQLFGF